MKRKILALVLAGLMVLGQSVAFAEADIAEDTNLDVVLTEGEDTTGDTNIGDGTEDTTPPAVNTYPQGAVPDTWTISRVGTTLDVTKNYFQVTNAVAYTGNNSLEICYADGSSSNKSAYIYARNKSVDGVALAGGNIKFNFKVKAPSQRPAIQLVVEYQTDKIGDKKYELNKLGLGGTSPFNVTKLEDGWYQFESVDGEFNIDGVLKQIYFEQFNKVAEPIYIDDMEIINSATGANMLENGGFEDVTIISENRKKMPTNVMVSEVASKYVTPVWTNPAIECEDVRLYEVTGGKNILLGDDYSTAAKARCHERLVVSDSSRRFFRLEFDYGNGEVNDYYFYGNVSARDAHNASGWVREYNHGTGHGYNPVYVDVDNTEYYSGDGSLRIASNLNGESNLALELNISYGGKFVKDKKYQISIWAKGTAGGTGELAFYMENNFLMNVPANNGKWKQYTTIFDTTGKNVDAGCLKFYIRNAAIDGMWIDKFQIFEVREDGTLSSNMLDSKFGEFEYGGDLAVPSSLSDVTATPISRGAIISWAPTASTVTKDVCIYRVDAGDELLMATVPADVTSLTINNLENGNEYTYIVKARSSSFVLSEGEEVSVIPESPATEIGEFDINGGTDVLVRGGNTFKVKAYNNYDTEVFKSDFMVALFKNGGKELVNLQVATSELLTETDSVRTIPLDIPDDGCEYTVQVYAWDSLYGLDGLKTVKTLTIK